MAAKKTYTKGTQVHVLKTDSAGFATNAIERDTDGQHWHVVAGKDPVAIDADDIQSIAAESESTSAHDTDRDRDRDSDRR